MGRGQSWARLPCSNRSAEWGWTVLAPSPALARAALDYPCLPGLASAAEQHAFVSLDLSPQPGSTATTPLLVLLLRRTIGVGRLSVRAHVKPPGSVRLLGVFLRGPCHRTLGKIWVVAHLIPRYRFPRGGRWVFISLGRSLSVSFLDRVGFGSCLGLGCL